MNALYLVFQIIYCCNSVQKKKTFQVLIFWTILGYIPNSKYDKIDFFLLHRTMKNYYAYEEPKINKHTQKQIR